MARRTSIVTAKHGRDEGKDFLITEMDAFTGEEWARDAVSSVYRCATSSDQGILAYISEGLREAFTAPVVDEIKLPSDGSLTRESSVIVQAQKEAEEEARGEKEDALNVSPMRLAATLGIRLFLQLPAAIQRETLRPLLSCVSFDCQGKTAPVMKNGAISEEARFYIEEASTILFLQAEAFKMHTDFFTPAVPSIYSRLMAATQYSRQRETSQEQ